MTTHTAEQSYVGIQLHRLGFPFSTFDVRYNTQLWFPSFHEMAGDAFFVHMASGAHYQRIEYFMKMREDEYQRTLAAATERPALSESCFPVNQSRNGEGVKVV